MRNGMILVVTAGLIASSGFGGQDPDRPLSYPGEQKTFHSGHGPSQKGYGHQGITKGGQHWFVFGTNKIYRYDTKNFRADQAQLKVKNEDPFGHPDFAGTGIQHMGAPHFHEGKVYSFAKTSNETPFAKAKMRLVWYRAKDLAYEEGSYIDLQVPPDNDGNPRVVSGGPFVVGEHFYAALAKKSPEGEKLRIHVLGKFSLRTGEYLEPVELSHWYARPQALFVDKEGNFYVMETKGHLKMFGPKGKFLGTVFQGAVPAIHEGFYYDTDTKLLTMSITKWRKEHGEAGKGIYIVEIDLRD